MKLLPARITRRSVSVCSVLVAAAALGALPAGTQAAATVGADLTQTPNYTCGAIATGNPCSFVTITRTSGVVDSGSPISGVLVSARVRTTGAAASVAVRVLRSTGSHTYLNVGPETPINVVADGTVAGHTTEVTGLHHPIQTGDHLGVGYSLPSSFFAVMSGSPSAVCDFRQGPGTEHPVDTAATYSSAGCQGEVLVQGTVEPDADNDTFGDETQDLCPGVPGPDNGCPVQSPAPAPPDTIPPQTAIGSGPKKVVKTHKRKVKVTFTFSSSEPGSTFQCRLDGKALASCTSPRSYRVRSKVKLFTHVFEVSATDPAGNLDGSPAIQRFRVKRLP
jgi:hypothetical protein